MPSRRLLRQLLALMVLLAAVVAARLFVLAKGVGEGCKQDRDCRGFPTGLCIHAVASYCTKPCGKDADCPTGWSCGLYHAFNAKSRERAPSKQVCLGPQGHP